MKNRFKPGDWNVICQRTGFKIKASEARREWNGLVVRRQSWEPRHPQDFVRGKPDNPSVPWAIVEPPETFIGIPNLIADPDGVTADGVYWDFGNWTLNNPGWSTSSVGNLSVSRKHDFVIGVTGRLAVGDVLRLTCTPTIGNYSSGSFSGSVVFYDDDRITVISTETAFTISSDYSAEIIGEITVPSASYAHVRMTSTLFSDMVLNDVRLQVV